MIQKIEDSPPPRISHFLSPINTRPRIYLHFDEIERIVNVRNICSFPLFDEKLKCVTFINLNSRGHLCNGNKLWK